MPANITGTISHSKGPIQIYSSSQEQIVPGRSTPELQRPFPTGSDVDKSSGVLSVSQSQQYGAPSEERKSLEYEPLGSNDGYLNFDRPLQSSKLERKFKQMYKQDI